MRDKENAEVWKGNEPESLAERFFFSRGLPLDDEGLSWPLSAFTIREFVRSDA